MFERLKKFDWIMTATVFLICGMSFMALYTLGDRSADALRRQITLLLIGFAVMFLASLFDYRFFKNSAAASLAPYLITVIFLIIVLASREIRGASSWIEFLGFRFEPSEFAKLALIILLAKYFSQKHVEIARVRHILASAVYAAFPIGLALLQPDLGSVIIMGAIWLGLLLFSGIKRAHVIAILIIFILVAILGWFFFLKPYQKDRITAFINPYNDPRGTGYNIIQSRITVGSGRILGVWGTTKNDRPPTSVPEPYTDFAFAVYAQKSGFLGVIVLFAAYLILFFRIGAIAKNSADNFAKLYSLGLMTFLISHIAVNIGMNLGVMPITGIPLPLVSHGGSHLVTIMAGLGLVQSIKLRG